MTEKEQKIQELQIVEQNLQNILMQKQAFQMELREAQAALKELDKSGDEVFKIIGQLMIRTDKSAMKEELLNKEKLIGLRIQSFEKQENLFSEKLESLQKEILK
jgi:prefoldin beta subunit